MASLLQRSALSRFDWALLAGAVFLMALGILSITSTSEGSSSRPMTQLVLAGVGLVLFVLLTVSEYRTLMSYAPLLYGGGLLLLVAVLVFGVTRNGARAWFDFGLMTLQPSEPMKLAVILLLATSFAKRTRHSLSDVWRSSWVLIPVLILVLRQPDLGTVLVFMALWITMVVGLNLKRRDILVVVGGGIATVVALIGSLLLFLPADSYQVRRLTIFPEHALLRDVRHADIGYQVDQALVAIGANQSLFGAGLGKGTQTHLGFLPAAQTDFIFAAIAEELGIFGVSVLLLLQGLVLFRLLRIARNSIDSFGSFVCLGLFGMMLFHLVENVGMNIGIMPVTGVPLLLVSSGGSHLLTTLMGLGIAESVAIRSQKIKV